MGFKQIVYLSETDKNTLFNTGTLTKDGKTVTYDEDNIYMTPTPETFGICSTGASTAAKTATITDFALVEGVTVSIQFTHTNTASNPTLNISSTGAVPIYKYGTSSVGITTATSWSDGAIVSLTYNGTGWIVNNYAMSAEGVGGGSVTSVRVQATSPIVSSTSTAQTATLDTTISLANANVNTVLAGPSSGSSAAAPSYRSLVPADIPSHNHSAADITSGTLSASRGGTGTSTAPTQYGIIYASTTSAYASTGAGSSGQYLKSNGTSAPTWATFEAATVGLGSVSNNANLNSTTGAKGDIIYWSAANTPAHLTNTSSSTKNFLSITSQVPSWTTLAKGDVGLGNVENTKLSTWTGSTYIKTVGTITSGTWNGTAIASSYIGAHNHAASNITSGQLGVVNGGTGAASFTANSAIISGSTTTSALTTRAIHNLSAVGNLGWTDNINTNIATVGSIAYWNGAYSGTNSNLQYLGAVVNTKAADTSDIVVNGKSSHLYLQETHITKGINPNTQYWSAIEFNSSDTTQSRLGLIEHTVDTSGNSQLNIFVVPNVSGSTNWSGIILKKDTSNNLTISLQGPTTVTSGTLTVAGGVVTPAITTSDGAGLLAYKPGSWNGISNTQWGVGTVNAPGVIRSSDNNLIHYRAGTNYAILDTYNCLEYTRSSAFVGRNAEITANKNWYKVASCSISDVNQDREMVLHVYDTMVTGAARSGILNVRVRTGSPLTSTTPALNLVWEYNNGFTSDQFKLVSNANASPCVAELWTNIPYNWTGRVFTVIRMGTRITGQSNDWTLYKNYSTDDNGATGSTSSLTNSVTASYLDFYTGTISATYKMPAGGTTYGIPFKNNDGNLAIASNLYWQNGGYTLRNQAPSGSSPAFQVAGPTKAISLMINSADTNRGLYDTTIDNWAFKLDSDSNLTLNGGKSTNTDSTITLTPNNSSTTYGVKINGYCAVALNIYAGEVSDTVERQTGARSKAGKICLYASGSATGDCGIYWWNNANTGRYIIKTAQDGTARFYGKADYVRDVTNSGAIDFDYMKSGGYSVTPWTCVWVNSNNNGQGGLRVGAVSTLSVFGYGIIYSSTQPTVVNGKIWLKPV